MAHSRPTVDRDYDRQRRIRDGQVAGFVAEGCRKTSVGPPNANGIGMESEGEMMSSSASTGEVGSVDAFVDDCAQGE